MLVTGLCRGVKLHIDCRYPFCLDDNHIAVKYPPGRFPLEPRTLNANGHIINPNNNSNGSNVFKGCIPRRISLAHGPVDLSTPPRSEFNLTDTFNFIYNARMVCCQQQQQQQQQRSLFGVCATIKRNSRININAVPKQRKRGVERQEGQAQRRGT